MTTLSGPCLHADTTRFQHSDSLPIVIAIVTAALLLLSAPTNAQAATPADDVRTAAASIVMASQVAIAEQRDDAWRQDDRRSKRDRRSAELEILPGHHDADSAKGSASPAGANNGKATASDNASGDLENSSNSPIRTLVVRNDPVTGTLLVNVTSDLTVRGASYDEIEELVLQRFENRSVRLVNEVGTSIRLIPRTRLGAVLKPVTGALASQLRLQDGEGLLIERIQPGLPAEQAGLRQHDILVAVDGERPLTQQRLTEVLATSDVGDVVSIVALRGGSEIEVHAALTENALAVRDAMEFSRDLQLFPPVPPTPPRTPESGRDLSDSRSYYAGTGVPPHLFGSPGASWHSESVIVEHRADEGGNRQIEWMERTPLTLSMLMNSGVTTAPLASGDVTKADIEALNARLDRIEDLLEVLLQSSSNAVRTSPTSPSSSSSSPSPRSP